MKKILTLFFFPPLIFASSLLQARTPDSIDLLKVKELVILECKKQAAIVECLEDSGEGILAREKLKAYADTSIEPLCLQASSGLMINHLNCLKLQLDIKESSSLAQYSNLILRVNEFRASWVSLCRNTNGHLVSDCVKSKTSDFYQMWNIYINLGKDKSKASHFEHCMSSQKDLDWSVFLGCYYR